MLILAKKVRAKMRKMSDIFLLLNAFLGAARWTQKIFFLHYLEQQNFEPITSVCNEIRNSFQEGVCTLHY